MTSHAMLNTRSKKIIAGVIALGFVLLVVLFVYAALVYPTKQPYRDAYAQYLNVKNANISLTEKGASINGAGATSQQFKDNIAAVKTALTKLENENAALAKVTVLQDGEGKAMYTAFTAKLAPYLAYNEDVIASIESLRPALRLCPDAETTDNGVKVATDEALACAKVLGELRLPNADYDAMATQYSTIYGQLAQAVAGGNMSQAEGLVDDLSDVITTFRQNLQKHQAEVDITKEAMALDAYLSKKSRIF